MHLWTFMSTFSMRGNSGITILPRTFQHADGEDWDQTTRVQPLYPLIHSHHQYGAMDFSVFLWLRRLVEIRFHIMFFISLQKPPSPEQRGYTGTFWVGLAALGFSDWSSNSSILLQPQLKNNNTASIEHQYHNSTELLKVTYKRESRHYWVFTLADIQRELETATHNF